MAIAPASTIEAPPRVPLPFGLFSVVSFPTAVPERWENGVTWVATTCDPAGGIGAPDCVPANIIGMPKDLDPNLGAAGEATPFTVYGHFSCLGWTMEESQQKAVDHLLAREEQRVEQAFWTGDLGNVPNLQGAGPDVPAPTVLAGGTAMGPAQGLALLEDFVGANYGSQGVIHLTRGAALQATALRVLEDRGTMLQTQIGTPVVAGGGYPGTGPSDTTPAANAAGTSWAYATPAVFGYRSEVFDQTANFGGFDRGTNTMTTVAERSYLLGFDPCGVAAVLLDLS